MGGVRDKEEGRVRRGSVFSPTSLRSQFCFSPGRALAHPASLAWPRCPSQRRRGLCPECATANHSGTFRGGAWPDNLGDAAGPIQTQESALLSVSGCGARGMERAKEAAPESQARAELPMEPVGSLLPGLEQPQGPESSPTPAGTVEEAAAAKREPSSKKQLPSPRPRSLRAPPLSLGYGAFGRLGSACPEPPSPGPSSAEPSRSSEAPGAEPAPGAWAPIELQVDVLVKPVGAAGSSRTPSPRPSTRFLTVPVPESPAFSRSAALAHQLLQRAPSPGSTWGRGSPLAAARTESGRDAESRASPAEGSAGSPSSPTCCRCKELRLEKEGAALLPCAGLDRDKKLPRAPAPPAPTPAQPWTTGHRTH
ncbi:Killer cell lectin-like receptor sub G member 2 [Saguinus oedipus]|uniref:Killer cell lectin-like receptor sub G member 2 n=1 Tax=Saguinus oedipus TaxID=9490 RepID=A0ABQ9UIW4_SAGOE|nr:Killer cell lectin-like receptor sub G member 2 [Saguinus oedipus]